MLPEKLKTFFQIPISDSNRAIGMIQMWSFDYPVNLTDQDIEMIRALCSFVPSVFHNISLYGMIEKQKMVLEKKNHQIRIQNSIYKKDIELAAQIQQSLIPSKETEIQGVACDFLYQPMAAIGGDFFDIIDLKGAKKGIFISDVSGHGVPAALITSMVKTLIDTAGESVNYPGKLLYYINQRLSGQTGGNFLTAFYCVFDSDKKTLTYARGAHNPPYLIRDGEITNLESKGKLIGVSPEWIYEEKIIQLKTGDKLLLYTDGLTEASNSEGEEFIEKIDELLRLYSTKPPAQFIESLYQSLLAFREDIHFEDDICMIGIEIE